MAASEPRLDPHEVRLARHRAQGPNPSPEEIARADEQIRAWAEEHKDKFLAQMEESDRVYEEWVEEGCPTPSTLDEMIELSRVLNKRIETAAADVRGPAKPRRAG